MYYLFQSMSWNLKKNTYIFITELLCCAPETNTTLLVDYTLIKKKNKIKTKCQFKKKKELLIART